MPLHRVVPVCSLLYLFFLEYALKKKKKSFDSSLGRASPFTSLLLLSVPPSHRNKNLTHLEATSASAAPSLCWWLMCCQARVSSTEQPNVTSFGTSSKESRCFRRLGPKKSILCVCEMKSGSLCVLGIRGIKRW